MLVLGWERGRQEGSMERWTQHVSGLYSSCSKSPHSVRSQQMSGPSLALDFIRTKYLRHSAPDEDPASWKGRHTSSSLLKAPGTYTLLPKGC